MKLPDFVYAKKFWEAVSLVLGGALALLAFFGTVDPSWAVPTTVILAWVLALLRMFGIEPELQVRALLNEVRELRKEVSALRIYVKNTEKIQGSKKAK